MYRHVPINTHTHTHTPSRDCITSAKHTHTHSLSLSHTPYLTWNHKIMQKEKTRARALTFMHTSRTHTHTLTHSLSLFLSHTPTHSTALFVALSQLAMHMLDGLAETQAFRVNIMCSLFSACAVYHLHRSIRTVTRNGPAALSE